MITTFSFPIAPVEVDSSRVERYFGQTREVRYEADLRVAGPNVMTDTRGSVWDKGSFALNGRLGIRRKDVGLSETS